jgi:phage-related protein
MGWGLEYYEDEHGRFPVLEFLDGLSEREAAKVYQLIQMLEEYGPALPFPYSSQIEGRLRELRTRLGKVRYRVLYYGDENRQFVLLHGLRKQTEKLPNSDKAAAVARMKRDIGLKEPTRRKT